MITNTIIILFIILIIGMLFTNENEEELKDNNIPFHRKYAYNGEITENTYLDELGSSFAATKVYKEKELCHIKRYEARKKLFKEEIKIEAKRLNGKIKPYKYDKKNQIYYGGEFLVNGFWRKSKNGGYHWVSSHTRRR